jgi:hypothetical protein
MPTTNIIVIDPRPLSSLSLLSYAIARGGTTWTDLPDDPRECGPLWICQRVPEQRQCPREDPGRNPGIVTVALIAVAISIITVPQWDRQEEDTLGAGAEQPGQYRMKQGKKVIDFVVAVVAVVVVVFLVVNVVVIVFV